MTSSTSAIIGSLMPPHLSGASPTSFYVGNIVLHNIVESGKKILEQTKPEVFASFDQEMTPITILDDENCSYTCLHQLPFLQEADHSMLVENLPLENLNGRDHNGNTPLMWASMQGDYKLSELLVDQGVAVNMQNFVGETALFIAAARGFDKICTLLLENGADHRLATIDGTTALHITSVGGFLQVVKTLVGHGAFVNAVDEEGDTPLHYAVREGKTQVVELLIKSFGADLDIKNDDLESPLDLALELDETAIVDLVSGSFPNFETSEHRLYFGEGNDNMQIAKKEFHKAQAHNFFARSVAATY